MKEHMYVSGGGTLQNKKGFTLIELLAVIVILAIIALIATPIVLDIINDSRNSSQLRSADFYLDAVEYAVSKSIIDNKPVENGIYNIMKDGNICLKYISDKVECGDILEVKVKGEMPKEGSTVTIVEGQIKKVNLQYEQNTIMKTQKGELAFYKNEYEIGDEVVFNPGDQDRIWNVIGEDIDTITLMLNENLGTAVEWATFSDRNNANGDGIGLDGGFSTGPDYAYYSYTDEGPITTLSYLNTLTKDWNIEPIRDYFYENSVGENEYDYQQLIIENGKSIILDQSGNKLIIDGISKARIPSLEELIKVASKFNEKLTEENITNFLNENISIINSYLGTTSTSLEEISQTLGVPITLKNKYSILFMLLIEEKITYDITIPNLLINNLYEDIYPAGYWTLSSFEGTSYAGTFFEKLFMVQTYQESVGIRPVITIPKVKLK